MANKNQQKSYKIQYTKQSPMLADKGADESSPLISTSAEPSMKKKTATLHENGKELRRSLGFKHAFVFVVGILFGSGIFISPGLVAKQTNNMGMAIIIWVISGIPCLLGALCYCELSCMYGKAGGEYIYISEAYGELLGFAAMWSRALVIIPALFAALCLVIGQHIVEPFYELESTAGMWLSKVVGLLTLIISLVINCANTSLVGKLQIWFTCTQTISVIILIILGIWQISIGHIENYLTMFDNITDFDIGSFGIAWYNALWAFDGWGFVVMLSEEIENAETNLWLSVVTGIPFVTAFYVLVNLALMAALTHDEIGNSSTVAISFVEKILGKKVAAIVPIAVSLSCFGCLNAAIFSLARILLSAAREGHLPYFLCFIHNNRRTPIPALVTFVVLSAIWLLLPGIELQSLVTSFSFVSWLQYGLAIFSVVILRIRKPHLSRPFKVWIINPIFTCLFALFLVIIPFVKKPVESTICLVITLSALPVYFVFIKNRHCLPQCLQDAMNRFNEFLKVKCNLVPCIFIENEPEERSC